MPNNYMDFIDEFKAGLQPADILTLLAGLRNTVPVYAALGATGTNEVHDEELARRWSSRAKATIDAPPNMLEPLPSQVELEQMMHRLNYPNPQVFGVLPRELSPNTLRLKAMVDAYNRQASDPYSPTTATRRKDFEEAPMSAQQYMSAAPKKRKFSKGGSMKKTLDEMQAEIAQKLKPQPQPDLSRRKFFGLGKAEQLVPFDSAMKLNSKDPAFQEALALYMHDNRNMFKNAPAITEKTVTVDPGKGAAKSTLKSLSETPMSRREVLQSAAGQVMRGVLPELGSLGNVAKVAESVAPQAYEASAIPGLMAALMRTGMSPDEAGAMVEKLIPKAPQGWPTMVGDRIKAPAENMPHVGQDTPLMSIFGEMVRPAFQNGPYSVRPEMRDLRRLSPEDYAALKETARDIKQYGHEN